MKLMAEANDYKVPYVTERIWQQGSGGELWAEFMLVNNIYSYLMFLLHCNLTDAL